MQQQSFFIKASVWTVALALLATLLAPHAKAEDIDLLLNGPERVLPQLRLASLDDIVPDYPDASPKLRKERRLPEVVDVFDGAARFTAFQPPAPAPTQPLQPIAPTQPLQPTTPNQPGAPTPGETGQSPISIKELETLAGGAGSAVVAPQTAAPGAPDIVAGLAAAQGGETVSAQHRSETSYDPVIRGYYGGQIYSSADSAYWFPARPDLDTALSKLDPALVQSITVIPGPYGVQYGPGLTFIDVQTAPTTRSKNGCFETTYDTLGTFRTNGSQYSAREIVNGGSGDWGFRLSAGVANGADYRAGNGQKIPSAYNNHDEMAEFGYDLSPSTRLEVAYLRFDQLETQYPGRVFDIDNLGTDAFNVKLVNDDVGSQLTKWSLSAWSNRTGYRGTIHQHPEFPTIERFEAALDIEAGQDPFLGVQSVITGNTSGNALSSGIRWGQQWGDTDSVHFDTGTDFRFLQQRIAEHLNITPPDPANFFTADSGVPTSHLVDPGLYAEIVVPWTCCLKSNIGARYDYVQTHASAGELADPNLFTSNQFVDADLNQRDSLWAAYITNEAKLTQNWTARLNLGHAENPPTLLERYSNLAFVGIAQSAFTRLIGDANLRPERDWQIDLSLEAEFDNFRGKVSGYHAWINDYITYSDAFVSSPPFFPSARILNFLPTRLATLTGFEWTGEYDATCCLSPFARMSYVYGVDQEIHTALPSIPPLSSQFGVRWHDPNKNRPWQVELFGRADYRQDHVGVIRSSQDPSGLTALELPTPGFLVWNIHAYYNYTPNFKLVCGIDNIFNRTYLQALDLRLGGPQVSPNGPSVFPTSFVYEPGISGYFGFDWKF